VASIHLSERGKFTYDDLTDDVAAVIGDLGEERAIILGESFGGTIALWFALRYPDLIERLIVVNSFPRFRDRIRIKLAALLAPIVPFRATWLLRAAASTLGLFIDGVTGEDRRRFFKIIRAVSREGYARRLRLIADLDIEERLSQIEVPTLLVAGDKDLLVPSVKEAKRMARRMPNAEVRVVKGAGHACLLGDRLRVSDLLAR
jgi:pimeloyl-ACP methyl ester carboxylesterase